MTQKMSREAFIEQLQHKVAGETINWKAYERFNIGALPKTISTLMKVSEAEAFMMAVQNKILSPKAKFSIITIMIVVVIAMVGLVIARNMGIF